MILALSRAIDALALAALVFALLSLLFLLTLVVRRVDLAREARERLRRWFTQSGALDEATGRLVSRQGWRRAAAAYALGEMASPEPAPRLGRGIGQVTES